MKTRIFKYAVQLVLITFSLQLGAQRATDYITYTQRSSRGFTGTQIQKLNRIISNPLYKAHYYVDLKELTTFSTDGTVTVNLPRTSTKFLNPTSTDIDGDGVLNLTDIDPYDPCTPSSSNSNCTSLFPTEQVLYTFVPQKVETLSPTEYTYYGEYDPCGEENGYIHIIAKNGELYGQININNEVYEIFDLGNRQNIMVKWENSAFPTKECASGSTTHSFRPDPNLGGERSGGCNVRVLVLFTTAADAIGIPTQVANLGISNSNAIANNSKAMVNFTLAGTALLPNFVETTDPDATFEALRTNPIAQQLRNQFQADIVTLLTDGNFVVPGGTVAGTSGLFNFGDPAFGFTVVEIDAANGRFTFSHELAHDFGCKHDNDDNSTPPFVLAARGHEFNTGLFGWGAKRRTNLTSLPAGEERIMHWSNPDVKFKGKKTGVTNERNNAAQMTSLGCTIANYRPFIPPMTVDITGPVTGIPGQNYTYCAAINSCPNVISIQWEYSFNGFHYIPGPAGNQICINLTMPLHGSIYVRVRVICQGGGDVTAFWETYNEDENPKFKGCNWTAEVAKEANQLAQQGLELEINPNPSISELNIAFKVEATTQTYINVIDIQGRLKKQIFSGLLEKGEYKFVSDLSTFVPATYIVSMKQGDKIVSKQILKL
jgi:hypothetical protein